MKFGADRYSFKAEDYSKYRPDFPSQVIDFLYSQSDINSSLIVADIGSGTGRFTKLLLEKGNKVYAVENNYEMRKKAEDILVSYTNFESVSGSAEITNLPDKSIDLITVAQAFHWFDRDKCHTEFKRVLKDEGKLFIVWDDFIGDYNDFSKETMNIYEKFIIVVPENNQKRYSKNDMLKDFCKDNKYETSTFIHEIHENLEQTIGGALSASCLPKPGEKGFDEFIAELERVFTKYQKDGKVCVAFCSTCYIGQL